MGSKCLGIEISNQVSPNADDWGGFLAFRSSGGVVLRLSAEGRV
jgi:hypothetical protein